jgi:uncharacterized protein YjdB
VNVGTASVTVTGKGNYQGSIRVNFTIASNNSGTSNGSSSSVPDTNSKTTVPVYYLSIQAASNKIAAGNKVSLNVTVLPKTATNKKLTWRTSNASYASVSDNGVVTTKKAGAGKTVTITATAADGSGKKASYNIQIMKGCVQRVTATAPTSVKVGSSVKIKTSVKATANANKQLSFASSNTKYATVTSSGYVYAYRAGKGKTVKITVAATDGSGKKATVAIKIK